MPNHNTNLNFVYFSALQVITRQLYSRILEVTIDQHSKLHSCLPQATKFHRLFSEATAPTTIGPNGLLTQTENVSWCNGPENPFCSPHGTAVSTNRKLIKIDVGGGTFIQYIHAKFPHRMINYWTGVAHSAIGAHCESLERAHVPVEIDE